MECIRPIMGLNPFRQKKEHDCNVSCQILRSTTKNNTYE